MSNYSIALERAIDRDIDDLERLEHCKAVVLRAIDAIAPDSTSPLRHPKARWHPGELLDELQGQLLNIQGELEHYKGPPVLDDEDY